MDGMRLYVSVMLELLSDLWYTPLFFMIRGIQIALAMLVFSFLPGVSRTADGASPSIPLRTATTTCQLPSHALIASLKYGDHDEAKITSLSYIQPVFTTPKPPNGSMTGVIGVGVAGVSDTPDEATTPQEVELHDIPVSEQGIQSTRGNGLDAATLFSMVNGHRESMGLSPLQNDENLSHVAHERAPELQGEMYGGLGMHAGFYRRSLPYWATENMISQNSEEDALNWWLNSGVHRGAIEGDYTHASVACEGKNCAMIFTSFAPK